MNNSKLINLILLLSVLFLSSCAKNLVFDPYKANENSDFSRSNIIYKDIPYDIKTQTKFDIIVPKSRKKVPLVIYIHGGGFTGGDKADVYDKNKYSDEIKQLTSKGIAFATINYSLLGSSDASNIMSCFNDTKRSLQFIRLHAKDFNIDENRIGLYGSSAGAGASLWLALSDDMKIANSNDAIIKMSTRVKAIAAFATQSTYDLDKWDDVFSAYSMTDDDVIKIIGVQKVDRFYGVQDKGAYNTSEILAIRKNIDLAALISSDDPPIWIENLQKSDSKPTNLNELYHHYKHGEYLFNNANQKGLEVYAHFPAKPFKSQNFIDVVDFFLKYL